MLNLEVNLLFVTEVIFNENAFHNLFVFLKNTYRHIIKTFVVNHVYNKCRKPWRGQGYRTPMKNHKVLQLLDKASVYQIDTQFGHHTRIF